MPTNNDSAGARAPAAGARATAARARATVARGRARFTAIKGAGWKILEFLALYTLVTLGTSSYLLVSIIGLTYSWGFYSQFNAINIFDFFDTPDFLLSAFLNLKALFSGIIVIFIPLSIFAVRYYKAIIQRAYLSGRVEQQSLGPRGNFILSISSLLVTFSLPFLWGLYDSRTALGEESRLVRVTIRQDAAQSKTRLPIPKRTLFLGTTSSFHFFYECENALQDEKDEPTNQECGEGRPFIVPTANIASLAFNLKKEKSEYGLSTIVAAIAKLNKTISGLNPNVIINTESDKIIFDTTQAADAITTLNETIKSLQLRVVSDPALGEVAKAIADLRSYLEGDTTITNLKDAITELNGAIKGLKPKLNGTSNTDSNMTAALKTLTKTLNKLTEKIASLNVVGVQNHCVSSLEKVATIGPFSQGKHEPDSETSATLTQHIDDMNSHFERKVPQHLMLVGRVDITPLSEERRKFYGSDSGLAQARAKWVRDELVKKAQGKEQKDALKRALLLSAGPLHVGTDGKDVPPDKRALDRSVEVWACGAPEPTPEGTSTPEASAG